MRKWLAAGVAILAVAGLANAAEPAALGPAAHPDTSGWTAVFAPDLSNAFYPAGIWTASNGVFTASADEAVWTTGSHSNFVLDLEFKTAAAANSGVVLYCTDTANWIPNSVEVQILDDAAPKWKDAEPTWRCGAIFGHLAPGKPMARPAGEWNRMTITAAGPRLEVILNGERIVSADLQQWTSTKQNPDGSAIPPWLAAKPLAAQPTQGRIGFQGRHAGAAVWFRNIRIKSL